MSQPRREEPIMTIRTISARPGYVGAEIMNHGRYEMHIASFEALLTEYGSWSLPKLKAELQKLSDEQHGGGIDYSDLRSVLACLFIMGELSGMATN
jgi:hypothetical protein